MLQQNIENNKNREDDSDDESDYIKENDIYTLGEERTPMSLFQMRHFDKVNAALIHIFKRDGMTKKKMQDLGHVLDYTLESKIVNIPHVHTGRTLEQIIEDNIKAKIQQSKVNKIIGFPETIISYTTIQNDEMKKHEQILIEELPEILKILATDTTGIDRISSVDFSKALGIIIKANITDQDVASDVCLGANIAIDLTFQTSQISISSLEDFFKCYGKNLRTFFMNVCSFVSEKKALRFIRPVKDADKVDSNKYPFFVYKGYIENGGICFKVKKGENKRLVYSGNDGTFMIQESTFRYSLRDVLKLLYDMAFKK